MSRISNQLSSPPESSLQERAAKPDLEVRDFRLSPVPPRVVIGVTAGAASVAAAFCIFGPFSDMSALQLAAGPRSQALGPGARAHRRGSYRTILGSQPGATHCGGICHAARNAGARPVPGGPRHRPELEMTYLGGRFIDSAGDRGLPASSPSGYPRTGHSGLALMF